MRLRQRNQSLIEIDAVLRDVDALLDCVPFKPGEPYHFNDAHAAFPWIEPVSTSCACDRCIYILYISERNL